MNFGERLRSVGRNLASALSGALKAEVVSIDDQLTEMAHDHAARVGHLQSGLLAIHDELAESDVRPMVSRRDRRKAKFGNRFRCNRGVKFHKTRMQPGSTGASSHAMAHSRSFNGFCNPLVQAIAKGSK